MGKEISAIICTHNRTDYLQKAISSLANQDLSRETFEIIVVDNCSTDSTRTVVESFAAIGNIRYLYEPVLGLSHARNTGWKNAETPYVAYLDDDAMASPVWLRRILQTFESMRPRPGCVGGRVKPIWEAPRPAWLGDEIVSCLTVIDWSDAPHVIENLNSQWLAGANIAFPKDLLYQLNGFTPYLDRSGSNLLSSGDVYLEKQIQKSGHTCFYQPDVEISHHIPASRLDQHWFIRRYYYQGISDAVMHLLTERFSNKKRLITACMMGAALLRKPIVFPNLLISTNNPERFAQKCFNLITLGHVIGLFTLSQLCQKGSKCP